MDWEKEQARGDFFSRNNHECLSFCYQHVLEPRTVSFASPAGEELMLVPCSSRGESWELLCPVSVKTGRCVGASRCASKPLRGVWGINPGQFGGRNKEQERLAEDVCHFQEHLLVISLSREARKERAWVLSAHLVCSFCL